MKTKQLTLHLRFYLLLLLTLLILVIVKAQRTQSVPANKIRIHFEATTSEDPQIEETLDQSSMELEVSETRSTADRRGGLRRLRRN